MPYHRRYERSSFDCGEPELDVWLQEHATQAQKRDSARTYVALDGERVVGYYAVCAYSLEPDVIPAALKLGRFNVPAILLARLAVDSAYQGRGLGGVLLIDALVKAATVAATAGTNLVVVHALHEVAAAYYEKHGFLRFETAPLHLYQRMKSVRETLRTAGLLD